MSNFIHITPFMHVHDLHQALTFFNDILGFETRFRASHYAYIGRETVAFRIFEQTGPDGAPPGNRRFAITSTCATSFASTPNSSPT
jgi:hypothetical protein